MTTELTTEMIEWVQAAEAAGKQDSTLNFEWEFDLAGPVQAARLYDLALEEVQS